MLQNITIVIQVLCILFFFLCNLVYLSCSVNQETFLTLNLQKNVMISMG